MFAQAQVILEWETLSAAVKVRERTYKEGGRDRQHHDGEQVADQHMVATLDILEGYPGPAIVGHVKPLALATLCHWKEFCVQALMYRVGIHKS